MYKTIFLMLAMLMPARQYCMEQDTLPMGEEKSGQNEVSNLEKQEVSGLKYYSAHLVTNYALLLGLNLAHDASKDFYKRTDIDASDKKLTKWLQSLLTIYLFYKLPQWTDKMLNIENRRTFWGNCFSVLVRAYVPYPLGVLISEFGIRNNP
ncbi:MAG: hypothetical protein AB7F19_02575 [Candidatus Babeliales bacterium]